MNPLRILLLLPFAPRLDAPHGGGRSTAELVSRLADRHRLAVLHLRRVEDPPAEDALRERCELLEEFQQAALGNTRSARLRRQSRLAVALAGGRPMWVADSAVAGLRTRVRDLVRVWRPDLVQAEFHVMAQYLEAVPSVTPSLVTEHEVGANAAAERARTEHGISRILYGLDALAWKRYEGRALRGADRVVAFTQEDAWRLSASVPLKSIAVVPFGIAISLKPLAAAGVGPPSIVFVGNYMHPPNVEAARRLMRSIFPLVQGRQPAARLYVVGPNPAGAVIGDSEGIEVTGEVSDVAPYLDRAAVVCLPISTGSGVRVKLLEALAAGKAVVATRRAVEGVALEDRVHALLADSDDEIAERLLEVIENQALRLELGRNARAFAERHLGWERTIAAYEQLYCELLQ
jgi:polysaccharide biosynthesis protein PslH